MLRPVACVACLAVALVASAGASAQTPGVPPAGGDTLDVARPDSLLGADAPRLVRRDTADAALGVRLAPPAEDGLEQPVAYTARDSVRIVLAPREGLAAGDRPADTVSLYGDATATYETATVRAARLDYLAGAEELRAEPLGTDSGAVGLPQFDDGDESFTGRRFVYNLRSRRGRVTGARTQIDDGYLLGGVIKQRSADVLYAADAAYTTCDLDHPHYALEAGRLKIVGGRRVYTGPVRLQLLGLPTPLWLPFGYFPAASGRRSGPLPVRYGRESGFGLYLDNVGWYWAASPYLDLQVAGKVGTEGSFTTAGTLRYNRLYAYQGSLTATYGRLRRGESTDPGFAPRVPMSLAWQHRQTLPTTAQLNASVNLQSTSQRLVTDAVAQQIAQSTRSSVAFSQSWSRVGRSVTANLDAYQDFTTGNATLTLPSVQVTQQRRFPFRRGRDGRPRSSGESPLDRLAVSYSGQGTNTFAFTPLTDSTGVSFVDGLLSPSAFTRATGDDQRFAYRVVQTVPVQTSFAVSRFNLSLVPSLTLAETWVGQREQRTYQPDSAAVVRVDQVPGFTAVRTVAATITASTELFGTFPVRVGPLDGLRHTVRPRASFSLQPDYAPFGFVREVQADSTGRTQRYAIVPGVPTVPTRALSFGIENALLARLARTDSTGERTRRTVQLLSLDLTGSVNFAADSLRVGPLSVNAASSVGGFQASGQAGFSAYALNGANGRLIATPYREVTGRPLRLTSVTARIGRAFSFGDATGPADVRPVVAAPAIGTPPDGAGYDPTRPAPAVVGYADVSAPLSFTFDVTVSHRPALSATQPAETTAALSIPQVNLRLTPLWSVTGSTGLDLTSLRPTQTALGLRRDLHCWELAIDWRPIGLTRGFGVSLYVKSGYLRDLLRIDAPQTTRRTLPF